MYLRRGDTCYVGTLIEVSPRHRFYYSAILYPFNDGLYLAIFCYYVLKFNTIFVKGIQGLILFWWERVNDKYISHCNEYEDHYFIRCSVWSLKTLGVYVQFRLY